VVLPGNLREIGLAADPIQGAEDRVLHRGRGPVLRAGLAAHAGVRRFNGAHGNPRIAARRLCDAFPFEPS